MKKVLVKKLPPAVFHVFTAGSVFLIVYLLTAIYPIAVFGVQDNDSSATKILSEDSTQETPFFELPGTVDGQGTYFEITDSEYLNITLDSSEEINLRMESIPEMITMTVEPSNTVTQTQITLSGFEPSTTYYKYEDNYHNLTEFTTDTNGSHSYIQDISQNHFVFIQTSPSTKFIADNPTGGDCTSIGIWDNSTKTCTLTTDINESIQIDSDGITLDGNGHTLNGAGTGHGVFTAGRASISVKDLIISEFSNAIYIFSSDGISILNNNISLNFRGISLDFADGNHILQNNIGNNAQGIHIWFSNNNTVQDNNIANNDTIGIEDWCCANNFLDNTINSNGFFGISLRSTSGGWSHGYLVKNNHISSNLYGIRVANVLNSLITDNRLDFNEYGIYLQGRPGSTFDYKTSNIEIVDNSIVDNDNGIYMENLTSGNKAYNNNIINNTLQAFNTGQNNIFDNSFPDGGNYWNDYDTSIEGCNDTNNDGFCDAAYIFSGGQDNLPWVAQDGWVVPIPIVSNLNQFKADGTTSISEGDTTTEDQITFKTTLSSPQDLNTKLQVELRQFTEPFTGNFDGGIIESSFVSSGQEASVTRFGLADGQYHWRARAIDTNGNFSNWQEFGTVGNVDFKVNTAQQPILFLHGINQSANDIRDRNLFSNLLTNLDIEFGEYRSFRYRGDRALIEDGFCPPDEICDSQTAIAVNAEKLRGDIASLFNDSGGQKITLMGYSMGSTIMRGYIALHPEEASQYVNNVFFLEGAQQGSYLLHTVKLSNLLAQEITLSRDPMFRKIAGIFGEEIAKHEIKNKLDIDLDRPAADDLTPRSDWYKLVNPEPVVEDINYYNFFGDIEVDAEAQIYIWKTQVGGSTGSLSMGDYVLLRGEDDPSALPFLGGARFVAQTAPAKESLQFPLRETITFNLSVDLIRKLGSEISLVGTDFSGALSDSKVQHTEMHNFTSDILVDDNNSMTDKIVNIIHSNLE